MQNQMYKWSTVPGEPCDIFFQDAATSPNPVDTENAEHVVIFIPWTTSSLLYRMNKNRLRAAYGVDKCSIVDVDETARTSKRLRLPCDEIPPLNELIKDFLEIREIETDSSCKKEDFSVI